MKRALKVRLELIEDPKAADTLTSALHLLANNLIDAVQTRLTGQPARPLEGSQACMRTSIREERP